MRKTCCNNWGGFTALIDACKPRPNGSEVLEKSARKALSRSKSRLDLHSFYPRHEVPDSEKVFSNHNHSQTEDCIFTKA